VNALPVTRDRDWRAGRTRVPALEDARLAGLLEALRNTDAVDSRRAARSREFLVAEVSLAVQGISKVALAPCGSSST
jgi:hypothetical protein